MDDGQLVSERDDFQVQRGARPDEKSERVEQRNEDGRHNCRLSENARNLNPRNTYKFLGSHSMSSTCMRGRSTQQSAKSTIAIGGALNGKRSSES